MSAGASCLLNGAVIMAVMGGGAGFLMLIVFLVRRSPLFSLMKKRSQDEKRI